TSTSEVALVVRIDRSGWGLSHEYLLLPEFLEH
ncbi:hypothetical protein Tco_1404477, partial [Tanacetum coccineum]